MRTRAGLDGAGRPSPRPLQPSAPALPLPHTLGPLAQDAGPRLATRTLGGAPLQSAPGLVAAQVSLGTERKATKQRSKQKAKEAQRLGSCGLAWKWGCGGSTERAGKGSGGRARLSGSAPARGSPFPPLPRLPAPSGCSSFLLPSGPLGSGAGLSRG